MPRASDREFCTFVILNCTSLLSCSVHLHEIFTFCVGIFAGIDQYQRNAVFINEADCRSKFIANHLDSVILLMLMEYAVLTV